MSRRSVQKKKWLESHRKVRAAFKAAVFDGKTTLWQAVCERVSGAYKFTAQVATQVAKKRKKKGEL